MGAVTVYIFYVIFSCVLHYALHKSVLCWKVCYIYFLLRGYSPNTPELYLCFIDMFVHPITVSSLICLCMLYNLIVGCTSSWSFCPIYLLCIGYFTTVSLLHMHLY